MRRLARNVTLALALGACTAQFAPSSIGLRQEPADGGGFRYLHRDARIGFVLPVMGTEGEREEDDAGFERVVMSARANDVLYRVLVIRPIDGTNVPPADAITRLADGLIAGQTPTRDESTMVGTHAARRITLPRATSSGGVDAMLITADDRALVMAEVVAGENADAVADPFFATLELGCDR
jgi:hypothetical protein